MILKKLFLSLATYCMIGTPQILHAQTLSGEWVNLSSNNYNTVHLIDIDGKSYLNTHQDYIYPNGELAYRVDQAAQLKQDGERVTGNISYYDSRGCSFTDLPIRGQVREDNGVEVLELLVTTPRYRTVTITTGNHRGYYRPIYCEVPRRYHRAPQRYICGHEYVRPSQRRECRLIETVEVAIKLEKM